MTHDIEDAQGSTPPPNEGMVEAAGSTLNLNVRHVDTEHRHSQGCTPKKHVDDVAETTDAKASDIPNPNDAILPRRGEEMTHSNL
jgi:hypothetical protein